MLGLLDHDHVGTAGPRGESRAQARRTGADHGDVALVGVAHQRALWRILDHFEGSILRFRENAWRRPAMNGTFDTYAAVTALREAAINGTL